MNAPFGDRNLRLNCPEYVVAESEMANRNWQLYLSQWSIDVLSGVCAVKLYTHLGFYKIHFKTLPTPV
ncbi:MAG: hypothetical protein SFY66_28965 [Oculatellaceae cyanobacterium bins.114]|nr:hypothetical protein [Oculatellaceae cyanobacterium bins.114]